MGSDKEKLIQAIREYLEGVRIWQIRTSSDGSYDWMPTYWLAERVLLITEIGVYLCQSHIDQMNNEDILDIERISEFEEKDYPYYLDATEKDPIVMKGYETKVEGVVPLECLTIHYQDHLVYLMPNNEEVGISIMASLSDNDIDYDSVSAIWEFVGYKDYVPTAGGFRSLENEFWHVVERLPSRNGYARLERLLSVGVDINANDKDNETLLSETILDFANRRQIENRYRDGEELLRYVCFMLDHGFDVTRNGGGYGDEVLSNLIYNPCDQYMVEAARMLMNAGADSSYTEDEGSGDVYGNYGLHADDAVVNYHNCKDGAVYTTIAEMMWLQQHQKDYNAVQLYTAVLGKKIEDIYVCDDEWSAAAYSPVMKGLDDIESTNVYAGTLIIMCEGLALSVCHGMDIMVNPADITEHKVSLRDVLADVLGETIEHIHFGYHKIMSPDGWTRPSVTIVFTLSNGKIIKLTAFYSECGEYMCSITQMLAEDDAESVKRELIHRIHELPNGLKVTQIRSMDDSPGDIERDNWWAQRFILITEIGTYRITSYGQVPGADYTVPLAVERITEFDAQDYPIYVDATEEKPITLCDYEPEELLKEWGEAFIIHYKNHVACLVGVDEDGAELCIIGALGPDGEIGDPDEDVAWDYRQEER